VLDWSRYPGWLSLDEGEALANLCQGQVVLELGSFLGRSTICIAAKAKHLHSVDWHKGDASTKADALHRADTLAEFRANLQGAGVADKVTLHIGRFEEILPLFREAIFGAIFVDGDHGKESVEFDIAQARRLVCPKGLLIFHDWWRLPVREAIVQAFGGSTLERIGSLVWLRHA